MEAWTQLFSNPVTPQHPLIYTNVFYTFIYLSLQVLLYYLHPSICMGTEHFYWNGLKMTEMDWNVTLVFSVILSNYASLLWCH